MRDHIERNGVKNPRVLASMRTTPRHEFVPAISKRAAYRDTALPIGHGQTISSPYIVARMTERLDPKPTDHVLEVGTGSGYQAAVLSRLVREVFTVEIVPELGRRAERTLKRLEYKNVHVKVGDGYQGWPENAPFDKIIVTCSPESIPQPLIDQLAENGHLIIPVGDRFQQALYRFTKRAGRLVKERIEPTFFVPMTGVAEAERIRPQEEQRPTIVNGGFEMTSNGIPTKGWYYIRNGTCRRDTSAPDGEYCFQMTRRSDAPAYAVQPVGVDGRVVPRVSITFWSRTEKIRGELFALTKSQLQIEFYDENRNVCGDEFIPIEDGTRDWKKLSTTFDVPTDARLAMIQIGLFGVSGTVSFDDVQVSAVETQANPPSSRRQKP